MELRGAAGNFRQAAREAVQAKSTRKLECSSKVCKQSERARCTSKVCKQACCSNKLCKQAIQASGKVGIAWDSTDDQPAHAASSELECLREMSKLVSKYSKANK